MGFQVEVLPEIQGGDYNSISEKAGHNYWPAFKYNLKRNKIDGEIY